MLQTTTKIAQGKWVSQKWFEQTAVICFLFQNFTRNIRIFLGQVSHNGEKSYHSLLDSLPCVIKSQFWNQSWNMLFCFRLHSVRSQLCHFEFLPVWIFQIKAIDCGTLPFPCRTIFLFWFRALRYAGSEPCYDLKWVGTFFMLFFIVITPLIPFLRLKNSDFLSRFEPAFAVCC